MEKVVRVVSWQDCLAILVTVIVWENRKTILIVNEIVWENRMMILIVNEKLLSLLAEFIVPSHFSLLEFF